MSYTELQKQCYLGVEQALTECEVIDSGWLNWFQNQALSLEEPYEDPIELIAHAMEQKYPEQFSRANQVLKIGDAINNLLGALTPRIPFAARLLSPTTFYENEPETKALCSSLLCPVSYAEGVEAIGIVTINPIAANLLKEKIINHIQEKHNITPYVSVSLANRRGWGLVCDKHFKTTLGVEQL